MEDRFTAELMLQKEFEGEELVVAFRLTRDLGNGEYASYWHMVQCEVQK